MTKIHRFDSRIFFFFGNEHRLILLCGHYNYHYNEPLWANAIFSILWLFIYFPICFLAIHGKYRYSVQFIQELKSNQIKAEGRFVNSCFRYFERGCTKLVALFYSWGTSFVSVVTKIMHWNCTMGIQILRQVTFQKCDGIVLKNVQDITLRDGTYDHIYGFRVYIQWLLIPPFLSCVFNLRDNFCG